MPRPCIRVQGTGSGVGAVHKKANCERERNEAPRPGASAVGLNSGRPLFGPRSRNGNSLLPDRDSLFRSLGNSVKKHSDLAGFELPRNSTP